MILTSAVGRFAFADDTPVSHAKMIRDSVVGAVLSPPEGMKKIRTEEEAYGYIRDEFGHVLSNVSFSLVMS